jgi:hypothetical protein
MGLGQNHKSPDLCVCYEHWQVIIGKFIVPAIRQKLDGSVRKEYISIKPFLAPVYVGKASHNLPPETMSRGNAKNFQTSKIALTARRL